MPYRRLPNTDQARIRALKAAVVKGDVCNVYDLAVSLKTLGEARMFLANMRLRILIMYTVMAHRAETVSSLRPK